MKKQVPVAQYLEQLIALSPLSQKDMAEKIGYDKPNMITMIKQGKTKLPLNKVSVFAETLGVDKIHLLRIVMQEYMPETLEALEEILGKSMVSASELRFLEIIRTAARGLDIDFLVDNSEVIDAVTSAIAPFVEKELSDREGAALAVRRR